MLGVRPPFAHSQSPHESAQAAYVEARKQHVANPTNTLFAWQFGRACFDRAQSADKSVERAAFASEGITACRAAIQNDPDSGPSHYYLALNLGQLAQTKSLGAMKLVDEMEKTLKKAIKLDASFDYGGPHRTLGLLYTEAPGWPVSIGNRTHGEQHLSKAVTLSPEYPDNHLVLLEAYLKWDDKKAARLRLDAAAKSFEEGRAKFTGEHWASAWPDWERRWNKLQSRLGKGSGAP